MENDHRIGLGKGGVICQLLVGRSSGANDCIYPNYEVLCSGCKIAKAIEAQANNKVQTPEVK